MKWVKRSFLLLLLVTLPTNLVNTQVHAEENAKTTVGWVFDNNLWYYYDASGAKATGWLPDGGKWYYLDANGVMKTGWLQDGGKWYYLQANGAMKTGWLQDGGKWYYFTASGAMQTGWLSYGGKWYYLQANGAMKTSWVQVSGKWYYLDQSGAMKTGWLQLNNNWYYLNPSGDMVTGWKQINQKWNFFWASGVWDSAATQSLSVKLNVPYVSQLTPTYAPMGCEGASLLMGLKFKGYTNESLKTLLDKMPKTTNNPYVAFAGSPYTIINGVFQSIFPKPLTAFGETYSNKVADATGYTATQLKSEIDKGNPVVVYVTLKFAKPVWATYNMGTAGYVNIVDNMHVMTLIGYNKSTGGYYVADPDSKLASDKYWVSQSAFETAYNALKFAVVVR